MKSIYPFKISFLGFNLIITLIVKRLNPRRNTNYFYAFPIQLMILEDENPSYFLKFELVQSMTQGKRDKQTMTKSQEITSVCEPHEPDLCLHSKSFMVQPLNQRFSMIYLLTNGHEFIDSTKEALVKQVKKDEILRLAHKVFLCVHRPRSYFKQN